MRPLGHEPVGLVLSALFFCLCLSLPDVGVEWDGAQNEKIKFEVKRVQALVPWSSFDNVCLFGYIEANRWTDFEDCRPNPRLYQKRMVAR